MQATVKLDGQPPLAYQKYKAKRHAQLYSWLEQKILLARQKVIQQDKKLRYFLLQSKNRILALCIS